MKPVDDEHGDDVPAVFVGRDAERTRIAGLTARTVGEGRGAVVVIRGDAGMGKTELARHVCADAIARGALVLWGTCRSDAPVPFQPFGEALGQLAREHPTLFAASLVDPVALSAILPELGEPPEPSTTIEQPGRYRVADAAGETLGAAARARGLLLVLDDLHEAPPATQRLASRSAEQGRLLVVATARNEPLVEQLEGTDEAVTRIDLPALTADDVQAFLALTLAADEISPAAAHFIAAETDGNPLFVRELTRALLASGALRPSAEGWIVDALDAVPATLSAALLERVSALPAPTRRALRAAAVLGRQFEVDQLVHMLGSGAAMLDDALRDGVIVRSGALQRRAFAHDLVRRTVYESIPEGARLELHELAAGALEELGETRTRDADVALHRLAAARLDPVRAVAAARRAGDTALARFSYEQAAEFYRRAHELVRDGSSGAPGAREACELAIRRGDALRQAGDARSLEVLLAAADGAERIRDGDLMAEAALALCYLGPTTAAGESDARVAAFSSRALARAHSARLRAQLAGAASLLHSLTGDPRTCRELFELAVREARAAADDQALAAVLPYAYLGLGDPDDLDRRGAVADELVDLARRLGHLTTEWEALQLGFSVMLQRGDPALDGAVARMDEIAAIVKEPARTWEMRYLRAARAHVHGRLDEAEAEVTRSLEDAGTVAESRVIAVYGAQMLAVRADQGRLSELAPAVEQLTKDQPAIAGWHAAMAMIAGAAGDRERATAEFDIAAQDGFADLPRDFIWTGAMTMLGFALDAVGDPERAAALYEHLAPYSGRLSWVGTCTLGPIDTALASAARLVHPERVQSHVAAAVALCERMNAPILRRRALANAEV